MLALLLTQSGDHLLVQDGGRLALQLGVTISASTHGVDGPGTTFTGTYPAYDGSSRIILIFDGNQDLSVGLSFGTGVDTATLIGSADGRLLAYELVPSSGATTFQVSWTTPAYTQYFAAALANATGYDFTALSDPIGGSTTSPIEVPAATFPATAEGTELAIWAASTNAEATFTPDAHALYTSNNTDFAALQVAAQNINSGDTSKTYTPIDRGLSGTPRNESAMSILVFPGVSSPHTFAAAPPSITFTAQSTTITHNNTIASSHPTLTLTAQPATFTMSFVRAASPATLTLTAQATTFIKGNNTIAAERGLVTFTAQPATFTHNRSLTADTTSISLTAHAATFTHDKTFVSGRAALTLTARLASFIHNKTIAATSRTLTLLARAATFTNIRSVTAQSSTITVTAQPATITRGNKTFAAQFASLTLLARSTSFVKGDKSLASYPATITFEARFSGLDFGARIITAQPATITFEPRPAEIAPEALQIASEPSEIVFDALAASFELGSVHIDAVPAEIVIDARPSTIQVPEAITMYHEPIGIQLVALSASFTITKVPHTFTAAPALITFSVITPQITSWKEIIGNLFLFIHEANAEIHNLDNETRLSLFDDALDVSLSDDPTMTIEIEPALEFMENAHVNSCLPCS